VECFIIEWPNNMAFIFCNNIFVTKGNLRKSYKAVKSDLWGTMIAG